MELENMHLLHPEYVLNFWIRERYAISCLLIVHWPFSRYVTILYFLNEPPEGGETAFPMADNATFIKEVS